MSSSQISYDGRGFLLLSWPLTPNGLPLEKSGHEGYVIEAPARSPVVADASDNLARPSNPLCHNGHTIPQNRALRHLSGEPDHSLNTTLKVLPMLQLGGAVAAGV